MIHYGCNIYVLLRINNSKSNSGCPHSHDALLSPLDNEGNILTILYVIKILRIFKYVGN